MSLRLRLALWYGALTTFVVALVCSYSYAIHSRTHYDELDRVLIGVAEHAREMISNSPNLAADIVQTSLFPAVGISIVQPDGQIVAASPEARAVPRVDPRRIMVSSASRPYTSVARLAPAMHRADPGNGRFGLAASTRGERFRVYLVPLPGNATYLAVTASLMHIDAAITAFARLMLLMALIGGIAAFGVG